MDKGFTIIEIIIVIFIATAVFVVAGAMFIAQLQLYRSASAISETRTQNILAQSILTKTIEEGFGVMASSTINDEDYISDSDTVILKLPSLDINQKIIKNNFDYLVFECDNIDQTKLISNTEINLLSSRSAGKKIIAQFVNNLNFGYNDSEWDNVNLIEITITTQKQTSESKTFKAVKLKNK